jgi:glutamine---fructose-6-phosphate transaminase (isomerizing)
LRLLANKTYLAGSLYFILTIGVRSIFGAKPIFDVGHYLKRQNIMCGIYAVYINDSTGSKLDRSVGLQVFEGLEKMEYRGYDSWGVVGLGKNEDFYIQKEVGKLSNSSFKDTRLSGAKVALGHTRWATHGGVTKINAHPHLAQNKSFALVQNGVVENYQELKRGLIKSGYKFKSETDTEVIVGLLEREMARVHEDHLSKKTFIKVFEKLSGRNTVALITNKGVLMAIRNGSPLVIGRDSDKKYLLSSDVLSMSGHAKEYMVLDSGFGVVIGAEPDLSSKSKVEAFKLVSDKVGKVSSKKVDPDFSALSVLAQKIDKEGFDSFMLKEIHEQAYVLSMVVKGKQKLFERAVKMIKKADLVFTLGAGTASFVAGHTAYLLRKNGIIAQSIPAYEADSFQPLFGPKTVCIAFSQSGETADTNEVIEVMKERGVKIISVVNMPGSTLTRFSDLPFMLDVGPEIAVASTKAFAGHMLWGSVIHDLLGEMKFTDIENNISNFEQKLSDWLSSKIAKNKIPKLAKSLKNEKHLFILGRGNLYYPSLESALKLKEISYIHAEGFSGGELKHGVIALIEKDTPVICLVDSDENEADMLSAVAEVKARGGKIIGISNKSNELYDEWIELPESGKSYKAITSVIPAQLLTCYMATSLKLDVDKPRNLAKSVTVK